MTIYYPPPNEMLDEAGNTAIEVVGSGTTSAPTTIKIRGNLDLIGELTAVQTTTIDDNNIVLNAVDSPSDTNADGGGFTLRGTTDKTIAWTNASDAWQFNQGINITDTTEDATIFKVTGGDGVVGVQGGSKITFSRDAINYLTCTDLSGSLRFETGGAANPRMDITSDGKVGIGTTSPTYALDVATSIASAFRVKGSTNGADVNCAIENAGTSATDDTLLSLTTQGGAGDAALRFAIAGNETWSMGIDNSDGDKLKISQSSTLHTDTRLTLQGNKVGIGTDSPATTLDVSGTFKVSGVTTLNGVAYTWPTADGSSGQQLTTDGSGALSWSASGSGGSGGISNVVEDTTPQLGGDLDCNSKTVTDAKIRYDLGTYSTSSDTSTSDIKGVYLINADTTSATFTIPSASSFGSGAQVLVKNTNSSNSMTLKTSGGTIDGTAASTGITVNGLASITMIGDGTNFHIL